MAFNAGSQGREETDHAKERSIPSKGNSRSEGLKMGKNSAHSKNIKEVRVATGVSRMKVEDEESTKAKHDKELRF